MCPIRDRFIPMLAFGRFTVSQGHLRLYRREFEMGPILSINSVATIRSALTSHEFLATQRSGFPDRYEVRWNSGRVSKLPRFRRAYAW
jgi:hypothetical protein